MKLKKEKKTKKGQVIDAAKSEPEIDQRESEPITSHKEE